MSTFGCHVSKRSHKSLAAAIKAEVERAEGEGINMTAAQIFVMGPKTRNMNLTETDIALLSAIDTKLVVHSAYVNHPWSSSPIAIRALVDELEVAHRIRATGVVTHLSKQVLGPNKDFRDFKTNLAAIADALTPDTRASQVLWLEINAAKQSAFTFETPEKLHALFNVVADIAPYLNGLRVGLCIDTAHLCSCGRALKTHEQATAFLDALPVGIPIMMHLNDSKIPEGGAKDRHEMLMRGEVWGAFMDEPDKSGLFAILEWATDNDIMLILERDHDLLPIDYNTVSSLGFYE